MQTIKAGLVYFALVFGAGFVLGTIRMAVRSAACRSKDG
jgi:hypothetical protein